ncbi:MAG: hypothetical protein IPP32_16685 [Bacteroidetes bacterium]|nr:hypothetical protein [Bacteroidota bacterium]
MDAVKIKLFGIGCRIVQGKFEEKVLSQFKLAAAAIKSPLQEALFDESFFIELNSKDYKSWPDLGNQTKIYGLLDSYQSIIEIKVNSRQKRRIFTQELMHENVLFPIYNTNHSLIDGSNKNQMLNIVEKEIGTIASYKLDVKKFNLEKLNFELQTIEIRTDLQYTILSKIVYDGQTLKSKKSDTLIKERFVLL